MTAFGPNVLSVICALLMVGELAIVAEGEREWGVRCDLQVVQVPQQPGLLLRSKLKDEATIARTVTELHEMIADGKAKLIAFNTARGTSGERAISETIEEIRYQTEWNPPVWPQTFGGKTEPSLEMRFSMELYSQPQFDVPTGFETRNIGITLEFVGTVLDGGGAVDGSIVAQNVTFLGMQSALVVDRKEERFTQPRFRTHKLTTQLPVKSVDWKLIEVNVIQGREPSMEFTLVRFVATPVER
jgi:hypothetical protein